MDIQEIIDYHKNTIDWQGMSNFNLGIITRMFKELEQELSKDTECKHERSDNLCGKRVGK